MEIPLKNLFVQLSNLDKVWILDIDGTLLLNNGYKDGGDVMLPKVKEFMDKIPTTDRIIILTGRSSEVRDVTIKFLAENGIRYDHIIFDLPLGERILINDQKPSGLITAYSVNLQRDRGMPL